MASEENGGGGGFGWGFVIGGLIGFVAGGTDYQLTLIPAQLVLGKMDHIIHVILGILFIVGGFSPRTVTAAPPTGGGRRR